MIEVKYFSDAANPHRALLRNIGFQLLMRRHSKRETQRSVARKIGFPAAEIDAVEVGSGAGHLAVLVALCYYYQQVVDFDNLQKSWQLDC